MTEEEAKKTWCPALKIEHKFCVVRACQWWQWDRKPRLNRVGLGYCGAICTRGKK